MSEMVERAAKAIWEARRNYVAKTWPDLAPLEEWEDGSLPRSNGVYEEARAAIEAMIEPTPAMRKAGTIGWDAMDGSPIKPMFDPIGPWKLMIKAALDESPQSPKMEK